MIIVLEQFLAASTDRVRTSCTPWIQSELLPVRGSFSGALHSHCCCLTTRNIEYIDMGACVLVRQFFALWIHSRKRKAERERWDLARDLGTKTHSTRYQW